MSDVNAIVGQALAQDRAALQTQVQISVLKEALGSQEAVLDLILETLGVGRVIDLQA